MRQAETEKAGKPQSSASNAVPQLHHYRKGREDANARPGALAEKAGQQQSPGGPVAPGLHAAQHICSLQQAGDAEPQHSSCCRAWRCRGELLCRPFTALQSGRLEHDKGIQQRLQPLHEGISNPACFLDSKQATGTQSTAWFGVGGERSGGNRQQSWGHRSQPQGLGLDDPTPRKSHEVAHVSYVQLQFSLT